MNFIGTKELVTDRLVLKKQTMEEQKRLWEILTMPEVNKHYLVIPKNRKEKFLNWNIQEEFYNKKVNPDNPGEFFQWSIFLKDTDICIGQISVQESDSDDKAIRDIGWFIDPIYHNKGYVTEAAISVLNYMFNEVDIKKIVSSVAVVNPASYRVMEKLGFVKNEEKTKFVDYTFCDEPVENYIYELTKEHFLTKNSLNIKNRKR